MPLVDANTLSSQIKASVDRSLAEALILEFLSLERRFILRDWEPAELDGGQFVEILARILYHQDSGNLNLHKQVDDCLSYLEDPNNSNSHLIQPRKVAIHLCRVLRAIYKFRSDRGAVHISPLFTANGVDARLISEAVRWGFSEFLRLYWNGDRELVAKIIREISQFDVPSVGKFGTKILVQRTGLAPEEELLILLHYAGEAGFSRRELGLHAQMKPPTVTKGIQSLCQKREVIEVDDSNYRLTDLGSKRVRENLAGKLTL